MVLDDLERRHTVGRERAALWKAQALVLGALWKLTSWRATTFSHPPEAGPGPVHPRDTGWHVLGSQRCSKDPEPLRAYCWMPHRHDLKATRLRDPEPQAYLLGNLLPLQFQHLLLLVGVIHDVPAPDEQLALHSLGTQRGLDTGFSKGHRIPRLRGFASLLSVVLPGRDTSRPGWGLVAINKNEFLPPASWAPAQGSHCRQNHQVKNREGVPRGWRVPSYLL